MTQPYTAEVRKRSDGLLDGFPSGPWDGEPDYVQWVDEETNLDCLAVRSPWGTWCGYVGVPPQHPLFRTPYQKVDNDISVHGGLAYSDLCQEGGKVCHVPLSGREHNIWWFGFDCAHAFDLSPQDLLTWPGGSGLIRGSTYRDLPYVKEQAANLAKQLKEQGK